MAVVPFAALIAAVLALLCVALTIDDRSCRWYAPGSAPAHPSSRPPPRTVPLLNADVPVGMGLVAAIFHFISDSPKSGAACAFFGAPTIFIGDIVDGAEEHEARCERCCR
jgi:hypothetical protein